MGPKATPVCGVCGQPSKYRCSACPVRYCSVACYKTHKETSCVASAEAKSAPAPSLEPEDKQLAETVKEEGEGATEEGVLDSAEKEDQPLRSLASLRWPPEPDASIFMDPLKRDDAKPLRHTELERIATSKPIRDLLAEPALTKVLTALDALPTANARHSALARVLGVDAQSLAKPAASAFMDRSSPPPLETLLGAASGIASASAGRDDWGVDGWWLGRDEAKVWIGPEERRLMRLWAGVTVQAIDGGEGTWGDGNLEWEV